LKFAICNEFCEGWKIEDVFKLAAEIGYGGVEIAPFTLAESVTDLDADRRKSIRDSAGAAGVEVVGLHWLLAKPEGLYINHPDAAVRERTRDYLLELIRCCADLGGKILVFGSPKQRSVCEGLTAQQAWELARETFKACGEAAATHGVTFCIEALARTETDLINTHEDAIRMVEEVDNPHFRMILDVKAMSDEETPIPDIIRRSAKHLAHFHANDANLRGPGFGDTDFVPIFKALSDVGYDGYVSVEVFDFKPDPRTIASKSFEFMKDICAGLGA